MLGELELLGRDALPRNIGGVAGPLVPDVLLFLDPLDQAKQDQPWSLVVFSGQAELFQVVWKKTSSLIFLHPGNTSFCYFPNPNRLNVADLASRESNPGRL